MKVLAIDIGGSHVKALRSGMAHDDERKVASGPDMTPNAMVKAIRKITEDWTFDAVAVGFPGVVRRGAIVNDPAHLGKGWVGFDFAKAFECPVHIINDAAMQAIGSYQEGHMLFLGLGTGLGSAMILDGLVQPMELAHLPYRDDRTYEDFVGQRGLDRLGKHEWRKHVWRVVELFRAALQPDEIVIGGGNIAHLDSPPDGVRLGSNDFAFIGGFRIWQDPIFRRNV